MVRCWGRKVKAYHNDKWGLSLSYPDDWEVIWENEPDGGWEIIVGVAGKPSPSGWSSVTIRRLPHAVINLMPANVSVIASGGPGAPMELPRTLEEYNEGCKRELGRDLPGVRFISEETGKVAGLPAATLVYSYDGGAGKVREKQINVFGSSVTYRLMSEGPEAQIEPIEEYFDSIVAGFKPVDPGIGNAAEIENPAELEASGETDSDAVNQEVHTVLSESMDHVEAAVGLMDLSRPTAEDRAEVISLIQGKLTCGYPDIEARARALMQKVGGQAQPQPVVPQAQPVVPQAQPPVAPLWFPTHLVPASGMPAWDTPDPSRQPAVYLNGGLDLVIDAIAGDWARVRAVNGWRGWVDGRRLTKRA